MIHNDFLKTYREILQQGEFASDINFTEKYCLYHGINNAIAEFWKNIKVSDYILVRLYDTQHNLEEETIYTTSIAREIWRMMREGKGRGKYSSIAKWKTVSEMFDRGMLI